MKKSVLWFVAILWATLFLTGCNSQEVWDVDYDLSTEMGRQLHCYAQFQKNVKADSYWAEWLNEVNNGFETMVEWKIKADDVEYNLVCNFSDDLWDWTIDYTPVLVQHRRHMGRFGHRQRHIVQPLQLLQHHRRTHCHQP